MIGVGEMLHPPTAACRRPRRWQRHGLQPLTLGPKEGLALLNGTQFSTAYALAALFEVGNLFRAALVTGVLSTEAAKGSDAPFDPRVHALEPPPRPGRLRRRAARADGRQRHSRVPPHRATIACRTPIACAASRR